MMGEYYFNLIFSNIIPFLSNYMQKDMKISTLCKLYLFACSFRKNSFKPLQIVTCSRKRKHPNEINETMKELNYKIKKGHVSYLWRGEGKRLYKAIFKKSWFININNSVLLVPKII